MLEHSANIVTGYFESAAILNQYQLYTQYKECFKESSPGVPFNYKNSIL